MVQAQSLHQHKAGPPHRSAFQPVYVGVAQDEVVEGRVPRMMSEEAGKLVEG